MEARLIRGAAGGGDGVLRGALLGVGNVAVKGHLPVWRGRKEARLVAAADVQPAGREAFRTAVPTGRWYESAGSLLVAEGPDFVDVSAPPAVHAPLIRMALAAGAHVLCEKPLVLGREDLESLSSFAGEKGLVLFPVHNWKHAPVLARATALVREGRVGRVTRVSWETLRTEPAVAVGSGGKNWRVDPALAGGGILLDHGWHALYAVSGWMTGEPRTLSATLEIRKYRELPLEDTATVRLGYGDAAAELFLTWAANERRNRAAILGTEGSIRIDGGSLELRRPSDGPAVVEETHSSLSEGSHHPDWFGGVLDGLFAEIADPKLRGRGLTEASLCLRLVLGLQESGRRGGETLSFDPGE